MKHWIDPPQPARNQRRVVLRAFLEGLLTGMLLAAFVAWIGYPIVTGQWQLL